MKVNDIARRKKILFLSGVDFKEKSIQVIRKTPEAYASRGWEVHYVVGRDYSVNGDYFYESVINPPGITVHRFRIPLSGAHSALSSTIWKAFWFRVRNFIFVLMLAFKGAKCLTETEFDVVYGYEVPGVLAVRWLRLLRYIRRQVVVTRFQGVLFVKEWLRKNQRFRYVTNASAIRALRTPSDLCIMTNDGSRGVEVLKKLRSPARNVLFVSNGVDLPRFDPRLLNEIRKQFYPDDGGIYLLSVSRLDHHKRIDRGIRIVSELVHTLKMKNVHYHVIGGGSELANLEKITSTLGLTDHIRFLGAINHDLVKYHLSSVDFFVSMYTSTNVGNPLLEAIRHHRVIVTLANGDTGEWIQHKINGLIYPVDDDTDLKEKDYAEIARDIKELASYRPSMEHLIGNLKKTEKAKLWTWDERFDAEVTKVESFLTRTT